MHSLARPPYPHPFRPDSPANNDDLPTYGGHGPGNRSCGNGWTSDGYFGAQCMQFVRERCPSNQTYDACEHCVHDLATSDPKAWASAPCPSHGVNHAWCTHHGVNPIAIYPAPPTFDPPGHTAHPCFLPNGTWAGRAIVKDPSPFGRPHMCAARHSIYCTARTARCLRSQLHIRGAGFTRASHSRFRIAPSRAS